MKTYLTIMFVLLALVDARVYAASTALPAGFHAASQTVGKGLTIYYVLGGKGEPVLLIHGFAETARMWRPIFAPLGKQYTVIAPDLPGLGGSSPMPGDVYDMKTVAQRLHALVKRLGFSKVQVVGHDIGMMAAYAYAAQYPSEVHKLILMDAPIPGIGDIWDKSYADPNLWHFHFAFSPIALKLVSGRERIFLDHFWISFSGNPKAVAIPESERELYAAAYAEPGAMKAGLGYFKGFPVDATDNKKFLAAGKLTMPLLTIGGERATGGPLAEQGKMVGSDVHTVILKGAGHWILEEQPKETMSAIIGFLKG